MYGAEMRRFTAIEDFDHYQKIVLPLNFTVSYALEN